MSHPKRNNVDTADYLIDLKIDVKAVVRRMLERPQELRGFVGDIEEACETLGAVVHILTHQ
jgi:hypothetical protein